MPALLYAEPCDLSFRSRDICRRVGESLRLPLHRSLSIELAGPRPGPGSAHIQHPVLVVGKLFGWFAACVTIHADAVYHRRREHAVSDLGDT